MPRKALKMTDEKIAKMIAEGRGQGEGANYCPFIQIGDFSNQGRGHRIQDHITGRVHHLLSDLEANYYWIVAWSDEVIDIREQYPLLPREETERIAAELGVTHPRSIGCSNNAVMTTDMLLTVRDANGIHLEARYIKYEKDLQDAHVCEKEAIERKFWENRGILYKIVTEKSIHLTKSKNIEFLLKHFQFPMINGIQQTQSFELYEELIDIIQNNPYLRLGEIGARLDRENGLKQGSGFTIMLYFAAHKTIPMILDRERIMGTTIADQVIDYSKPLFVYERDGETSYADHA